MDKTYTVTGWTYWGDDNYIDISDYDFYLDIKNIVVKEIREKGYYISGFYHQDGKYGTPIINNKYILTCSYRGWGDVMHMAYPNLIESYIDYAWSAKGKEIVPIEGEIKHEENLCDTVHV